jgi:hypothetical protein
MAKSKIRFITERIKEDTDKKIKVMNGKEKTTLRIIRKGKQKVTKEDVEDIHATFRAKLGHERFVIIGYADGTYPFTLKAKNSDLRLYEVDQYLEGRVNFDNINYVNEFYQLHIAFYAGDKVAMV